jgi:acetyltransferase-like isoleucine patch superfamily enzyme
LIGSIVGLGNTSDGGMIPNAAMTNGPINIDYGTNLHIHGSCFVNRDCYIADSPDCTISVGENTIIGVGVQILGVTHPINWRERQGRFGMSLAVDVKIGNDCFIGARVIVL